MIQYMGVSENSVPLNPMVNDPYPYKMAIIGNIPYFQTNPYFNLYVFAGLKPPRSMNLTEFGL